MSRSRIAAVLVTTAAFFGVLCTPAQAEPLTDHLLAIVGDTWGGAMPASMTQTAANAALDASGR